MARANDFRFVSLKGQSTLWAGMLDGQVFDDETFHTVIDAAGEWRIGVQLAPHHRPPDWPNGAPQQVQIDVHVDDPVKAHAQAMGLGARLVRADDLGSDEGHQAYADPAGHPLLHRLGTALRTRRVSASPETLFS